MVILILKSRIPGLLKITYQFAEEDFAPRAEADLQRMSGLERPIRIALQKRPVEHERMDQMISGIVRRLESSGETDIPSNQIGEIVMESLARIDTVAYVRFASVYKNFQNPDDFDKFVSELRPKPVEE